MESFHLRKSFMTFILGGWAGMFLFQWWMRNYNIWMKEKRNTNAPAPTISKSKQHANQKRKRIELKRKWEFITPFYIRWWIWWSIIRKFIMQCDFLSLWKHMKIFWNEKSYHGNILMCLYPLENAQAYTVSSPLFFAYICIFDVSYGSVRLYLNL